MTVTVKTVRGSIAVVLPKAIALEMELAEGTALEISTTADAIVMRPRGRRRRRPLARLIAQINSANYRRRGGELGKDPPVGNEAW